MAAGKALNRCLMIVTINKPLESPGNSQEVNSSSRSGKSFRKFNNRSGKSPGRSQKPIEGQGSPLENPSKWTAEGQRRK